MKTISILLINLFSIIMCSQTKVKEFDNEEAFYESIEDRRDSVLGIPYDFENYAGFFDIKNNEFIYFNNASKISYYFNDYLDVKLFFKGKNIKCEEDYRNYWNEFDFRENYIYQKESILNYDVEVFKVQLVEIIGSNFDFANIKKNEVKKLEKVLSRYKKNNQVSKLIELEIPILFLIIENLKEDYKNLKLTFTEFENIFNEKFIAPDLIDENKLGIYVMLYKSLYFNKSSKLPFLY